MDINEVIDKALKSGGGYLNPTNMYGVVGDPITCEVFVCALNDLFTDNLRHFILGQEVSLVLLGVYTCESEAKESVVSVLVNNRLGTKGPFGSPDWYVLMADTLNNTLFSIPLLEYYAGYFTLFLKYSPFLGQHLFKIKKHLVVFYS